MFKNDRVEVIDFEKEQKRRDRKDKFNRKIEDVERFVFNNKEMIIAVIPFMAGGTAWLVKRGVKHSEMKKQEDLKNLYCYDRSLGHYWKLKRELTNSEWVEIDKRKKNGEHLADILDELKVLK
jgi:hypothetical protein